MSRYGVYLRGGTELGSTDHYWEACHLLRWHGAGGYVLDHETGEIDWSLCIEPECDSEADLLG